MAAAIPLQRREARSFPTLSASTLPALSRNSTEHFVCRLISLLKFSEYLVSTYTIAITVSPVLFNVFSPSQSGNTTLDEEVQMGFLKTFTQLEDIQIVMQVSIVYLFTFRLHFV